MVWPFEWYCTKLISTAHLIGSLTHHQNLTPCWHHGTRHTCQVFIFSHSSHAEQYGDMSSDIQTHSHTPKPPTACVRRVGLTSINSYIYKLSTHLPDQIVIVCNQRGLVLPTSHIIVLLSVAGLCPRHPSTLLSVFDFFLFRWFHIYYT